MPIYRAVLVTPSCARVAKGTRLSIEGHPGRSGAVSLKLHTPYTIVEGASIPGLLTIEVEGQAEAMGLAMRSFIEAALDVAAVLAVAANATVDAPQLERAYDITPGAAERGFYKNFRLHFSERERRVREAPTAQTTALLKVLSQHADSGRLLRSARQYRLALTYWEPGLETLALAHLWMGVEALVDVALRQELSSRQITEETLASDWALTEVERSARLHSNLVSHARRRIIFQGDDATHAKARNASDGFEHGFRDLPEVDALSSEVKTLTAKYLRQATLRLALGTTDSLNALLGEPYNFILHAGPSTFELRAALVGDVENLAPAGLEHPDVEFDNLSPTVRKVDGGIEVRYEGFARWQLGDGVYAKKNMRIVAESTPTRDQDPTTKPMRIDIVRLPREGDST